MKKRKSKLLKIETILNNFFKVNTFKTTEKTFVLYDLFGIPFKYFSFSIKNPDMFFNSYFSN